MLSDRSLTVLVLALVALRRPDRDRGRARGSRRLLQGHHQDGQGSGSRHPGKALKDAEARQADDAKKAGSSRSSDGRLNQLTEDPADTEPSFAPDGRAIVFARDGDVYTSGPTAPACGS